MITELYSLLESSDATLMTLIIVGNCCEIHCHQTGTRKFPQKGDLRMSISTLVQCPMAYFPFLILQVLIMTAMLSDATKGLAVPPRP